MDRQVVNNIKSLSLDMIEASGSGHAGIALGAAPIIYTIFAKHMNINVMDPNWLNRDRFILSAGHGSALLYSTLFMAGYNLSLDDLQAFRKIDSKTKGHPEYDLSIGVEMTTGLLGQGFASSVGMALASKLLNKKYEMPKKSKLGKEQSLFDYNIYTLCSDGDLMEGISYEAASLAGTLGLNNLIVLYDSNDVSLDGSTNLTFNENVLDRFKAMNWNTIIVKDGNSISSIDKAITEAKLSSKPTLIEVKTVIGADSPYENTNLAHSMKLNKEEISKIKSTLNIEDKPFYVNLEAKENFKNEIRERSIKKYDEYLKKLKKSNFNIEDINIDLSSINIDTSKPLKEINSDIMNQISSLIPNFIGGSADLGSSTKTILDKTIDNNFVGNYINYGVREHAMGAIANGLALSGYKTFNSTYLTFSDYQKPALRLSALMNLPVSYIYTHDSINIGADGPTHQPIEQLISLRSIPNLLVFRPCSASEIIGYWNIFLNHKIPSCLVLPRNEIGLNIKINPKYVGCGGYIIRKETTKLYATIISTGSDVLTSVKIADYLFQKYKVDIRVVSMPCRELFLKMPDSYKSQVIPKGYRTIVIEAGSKYGWEEFVIDNKYLITLDNFGFSGTKEEVLDKMGFSYEKILEKVINLLK